MEVRLIPYRSEHQPVFKALNMEWLDHYQLTESHDLLVLDDPEGTVINRGGFIWMAETEGKIVGSAGLAKENEDEYELVKMAVAKPYQGKGISKQLIEKCLAKARELGARKVSLYSNHQLQRAISLYENYGFSHVELVNSPLETADVRMELVL